MPFTSEEQLIRACLAKKRKAQFAFYNKYKSKMYAVCLRYAKDASQAQDFLQEGFTKAFTSLKQYRFEVSIEHWLRRIMINACISELRRKREPMDRSVSLENFHLSDTNDTEEEVSVYGFSADEVIRLIQELPEGYRTIFNLYAIEGYAHDEIASIMEISSGTSRSQYARARKALAKAIENQKVNCHE
jgi:RNA polymerase sigma-70 factor (ECF subfamily)